jgi:long-subunit fatty acid transport protein
MTTTIPTLFCRSVCIAILLMPAQAAAQSTDDGAVFDFSLPGARSRGMGGAFVAIADDASSVYSNPAGLTSLFRPEVSLEVRVWDLRTPAIDRGHAFGSPTNIGIDNLTGVHDREFAATLVGPAFLSAVYPSGRWAVGVFHHQLVRYKMSQEIQGAFFDCRGGGRGPAGAPPFCEQGNLGDGVDRIFPARQDYEVNIAGTGVGFAFKAGSRFSAGVSVQVYDFDITRVGLVYGARGSRKFAEPDWSAQNLEIASYRLGKDSKPAVNAGMLWNPAASISVGATYRQGQTFHYLSQNISGPANPPGGTMFLNEPNTPFRVPDTWAAGIAFKPNNSWRVGFEYDRVQYQQVMDNFANTSLPPSWPEALMLQQSVKVDNSDQLRIGGEYSWAAFQQTTLSFRLGMWTDPFHQPYLEVTDAASGLPAPGWAMYLPKRDDQTHFSGGVGLATPRHFQVDFAIDHSPSVTTYSISSIYRF